MELKEVIGRRRTIRIFVPYRPVEREKVQKMLEAARRASCAGNVMNVRAIVIWREQADPKAVAGPAPPHILRKPEFVDLLPEMVTQFLFVGRKANHQNVEHDSVAYHNRRHERRFTNGIQRRATDAAGAHEQQRECDERNVSHDGPKFAARRGLSAAKRYRVRPAASTQCRSAGNGGTNASSR